jgi:hypothetical protein
MSQVENAVGFVFGALFVLAIMVAVGVAAAFLVYLYSAFPWPLRLLAAVQALAVGAGLLGTGAWFVVEDFRDAEPRYVIAFIASFLVLWMYNGLLLHLAGAWGMELDGFTSWVLGFQQASIDWGLGIAGAVLSYVGGFFVALIDALGGDDFRFPDLPSLPDMTDVDVSGPSVPPISSGGLEPVMSWAIESIWSLILGIISAGIGVLIFRQQN